MAIYTAEHRLLQESIRRFADAELLPYLSKWEEAHNFPSEVFRKLGAQGFLGILLSEKWNGVGGDYLLAGAWCEEFGRIPAVGLTTAVNMHSLVITPTLERFGSEVEKEKWLARAVRGDAIGAYAFTEPGAGSDLTQIQTRAKKIGDSYLLNGSKIFITNGKRAQFVLVLARTDSSTGYEGFTTFVVDTSLPGFSVARTLNKLGWHSSDTAELVFTDLCVPASAVLGEEGKGWQQAMQSLEWERLMLALGALGGAKSCLEKTLIYVQERKLFGETVGSFDANRERLFLFSSRLRAGEALCHRALRLLHEKKRCRKEVSLAKLFVCQLAIDIADFCLQLHGGYGYTTEFLPERWLRDLRLNTIGGGTNEVMSRIAAREIFGESASES